MKCYCGRPRGHSGRHAGGALKPKRKTGTLARWAKANDLTLTAREYVAIIADLEARLGMMRDLFSDLLAGLGGRTS